MSSYPNFNKSSALLWLWGLNLDSLSDLDEILTLEVLGWWCSECLEDVEADALWRNGPSSQTLWHRHSFRLVSCDLTIQNYKHMKNVVVFKSQGKQQIAE